MENKSNECKREKNNKAMKILKIVSHILIIDPGKLEEGSERSKKKAMIKARQVIGGRGRDERNTRKTRLLVSFSASSFLDIGQ